MSLTVLRWSIALVLGGGAALLLASVAHADHDLAHLGHAGGLVALGVAELVAAALFVVPRTLRLGGFGLLGVLAAAALLHAALGEVPSPSFVVYAAAIWVAMARRPQKVAS